jgi:RHS repeat-associated protein
MKARLLLLGCVSLLIWSPRAEACAYGDTRECVTRQGCVGYEGCSAQQEGWPGDWTGVCIPTYEPQPCMACGGAGTQVCSPRGGLGPCQPVVATPERCGNGCDDDVNGQVDEGCAGAQTYDYCQSNGNGTYTRWRCSCEEGLRVGWCLGAGDSQETCNSPGGCLRAPGGLTAGNYTCCPSSLPCEYEGYVSGAFQCGTGFGQRYECRPGTSCTEGNLCERRCVGVAPVIAPASGERSEAGAMCRPVEYSACSEAQGGLGSRVAAGGVRAMSTLAIPVCGIIQVNDGMPYLSCPPSSIPTEPWLPSLGGGSWVGSERGEGASGDEKPRSPAPEKEACGPASAGPAGAAMASLSVPGVSLSDLATRHWEVDVEVKSALGALRWLRKYVSTDETWAYQALVGGEGEYFLPKPFGASPGHVGSLRWWHGLYSFVYPQGWVPGVSTWAVRDVDGAVLEYEACSAGAQACFARPRTTSRWSSAQLYWTGGGAEQGHFLLIRPGDGRYVYAAQWRPPAGPRWRYFLSQVEEEVRPATGAPRVRWSLGYSTPEGCPGASATGNGVPYLSSVTTGNGATLRPTWQRLRSVHTSTQWGPGGYECVLQSIALEREPNAGNHTPVTVAEYNYPYWWGEPYAGALASVYYPETGNLVAYTSTTSTLDEPTPATSLASWAVTLDGEVVGSHTYTGGKVSGVAMAAGPVALALGDCGGPEPQALPSPCQPASATPVARSAGDAAGSTVQVERRYQAQRLAYLPYKPVSGYTDFCRGGACPGLAAGNTYTSWTDTPEGFLLPSVSVPKQGGSDSSRYTLAQGVGASPVLPRPVAQQTRVYGVTATQPQGVYTESSQWGVGEFVPGAPVEPYKPVVVERDSHPSALVAGQQAEVVRRYEPATHRLLSILHSGYTETFDSATGQWSGPVLQYTGLFAYNHYKCLGGQDTGGAQVLEVQGPCLVSGPEATGCQGNDYPITQLHYYGPPGTEPTNRAGQVYKVVRYVRHGGPTACSGYPTLEQTFEAYEARGNPTRVRNEQGLVAELDWYGGRLGSIRVGGLVTSYHYDGPRITAVQHPAGHFTVSCYREQTLPGQGCRGGQRTKRLQWVATAADAVGVNWSEKVKYTYWPQGALKTEEYLSRYQGGEEVRRRVDHHPDAQGQPTYTRWGVGPGSFTAVASFDRNGNQTGAGLPYNSAPDWCQADSTGQPLSQLCAALGYDSADRLTSLVEWTEQGVEQRTLLGYDRQNNVSSVQTGCAGPTGCTQPVASYTYDDFGRPVRVQLPHAEGPVRYAWNSRDEPRVKQTEAMRRAGEWLEYRHDLLSRPREATRVSPGATPAREPLYRLGYDNEELVPSGCGRWGDSEPLELNARGRLRWRDDSFGRTWYRYDTRGLLVGELRVRQGETRCDRALETWYGYDWQARLWLLQYPHGRNVAYRYGTGAEAGRVVAVEVGVYRDGSPWERMRVLSQVRWEPFGGLRGYQVDLPQGGALAVEYMQGDNSTLPPAGCTPTPPSPQNGDQAGRLRSLRVSSGPFSPGQGSGDVFQLTYTWKADQVVRTDTCLPGQQETRTELFAYDRTLRLLAARRPTGNLEATGGAFGELEWSYDRRSNQAHSQEEGVAHLLQYGTGSSVDRLLSRTSGADRLRGEAYAQDADGRVVRKEVGWYLDGAPAHVLELGYGASEAGSGSAREDVLRLVRVNGLTYTYYYDALKRRRAKVYPTGVRDEYFYGTGHALLVDQGWDSVVVPGERVVDEYVWLGGRPVVLLRGRLAQSGQRADAGECARNGEAATCGVYFPVTDVVGKPVLMLDEAGRIAGEAAWQPFGGVNRVAYPGGSEHPYPEWGEKTLAEFAQPLQGMRVRMRALLQVVDVKKEVHSVRLEDMDTGKELWRTTGEHLGRVVTPWVEPMQGRVRLVLQATSPGAGEPELCVGGPGDTLSSGYTGIVVEGYEYQHFNTEHPSWTPLRFPGQYHDEETGWYNNWNRYYDPASGRYLQPEPLLAVGPTVSMAAYAYAANNPVHYIDPDGLRFVGLTPTEVAVIARLKSNPVIGTWVRRLDAAQDINIYLIRSKPDEVGKGSGGVTRFWRGILNASRCEADVPARAEVRYNEDAARDALQSQGLTTSLDELIAHELGHVDFSYNSWLNQSLNNAAWPPSLEINNKVGVDWENAVRFGPKRRQHDY